jgi:hypothetical protein
MVRDPKHARPALRDAVRELRNWLPEYTGSRELRGYPELIGRILASVPGGDRAEDMGFEPFPFISWKELDMLGNLIHAIQDSGDVEYAVYQLFESEDEEE